MGSRTSTFYENQRRLGATVVKTGIGDSRYRRNGHGGCLASFEAEKRAMGGHFGVMGAPNIFSTQWGTDGLARAHRRTVNSVLSQGFSIGKPTNVLGIMPDLVMPSYGPITCNGAVAHSFKSGTNIVVTGDISWWTSTGYVKIDNEIIYYTAKSGQNLTIGNSTTVATQGALSGTGTGTFTVASAPGDWPTAAHEIQIDSEIMNCTRSGTTITITARGARGTTPASHAGGATVGVMDMYRAQNGSCQASHSNGASVFNAATASVAGWLNWAPCWMKATTLQANITNADSSLTIASGDQEGWPVGNHYVKIDSEYMLATRVQGSTTLSITRAQWSSSAASHTAGARIGIADWNPYSGLQIWQTCEIGNTGMLKGLVFVENPEASAVSLAQIQPTINLVAGEGMDAVSAIGSRIGDAGVMSPSWTSAAGELGVALVTANASDPDGQRSAKGILLSISGQVPLVGPAFVSGMILKNGGRTGGGIQTFEGSQGGRRLVEWLWGVLTTTGAYSGLVRRFQQMRIASAAAYGGNNKVACTFDLDMGSNDTGETQLAFASAGQTWTRQYAKILSQNITNSQNTIPLTDVTGLPTMGHFLIPSTGERCHYNGISGTTLQNVVRGQFRTTANSAVSSAEVWFGYQSRDPYGMPANVYFAVNMLNTAWNLADVHTTNASYPLASSGAWAVSAASTGTPDFNAELLVRWVRPHTRWDSPTSPTPAAGATLTDEADIEARLRQWVSVCQGTVMPLLNNFDVVDLGPEVMTAEEQMTGGYGDLQAATTLNGAIDNSQTTITVTSTSGWPQKGYMNIDGEIMKRTSYSGTSVTVVRGVAGGASSHSNGAAVLNIDNIHQSGAGFLEAWTRWAAKNVAGSSGAGTLKYSTAALRASRNW